MVHDFVGEEEMKDKINGWIVLQDITAILLLFLIPLYVLLQVIKGINYFEPLSILWYMFICIIIIMLKSNVMGLGELDRVKKYLGPIIKWKLKK